MSVASSKPTDEELEAIHFNSVVAAFEQYRSYSLSANSRRLKDFYNLPTAHQKLLNELGWRKKIDLVDEKIEANAKFLKSIIDYPQIFEDDDEEYDDDDGDEHSHGDFHDTEVSRPQAGGSQMKDSGEDGHEVDPKLSPHPYDSLRQPSMHSHDGHNFHASHEQPALHSHDGRNFHASHTAAPPMHSHDGHNFHSSHDPQPQTHTHDGRNFHSSHDPPPQKQHTHDGRNFHSSHDAEIPHPNLTAKKKRVSDADMDKVRSTLKQFVRDWSIEGKPERDACYGSMIEALDKHFVQIPLDERKELHVLVPGTGLGRLPYEVIKKGYSCQGNEFSHYMLLSSYFILNRTTQINQHTIYPYIHSFSNMRSSDTLLREIKIPDALPLELPKGPTFSLVAGDFEEIYGKLDEDDVREPQQGKWDAVLTCFFIDTAKNIVNYLTIIYELLKPGGIWINLGPLLWHFENAGGSSDPSIELSLDEVRTLAENIGFRISDERAVDTTYTGIDDGMLEYVYHTAFWTATKKESA